MARLVALPLVLTAPPAAAAAAAAVAEAIPAGAGPVALFVASTFTRVRLPCLDGLPGNFDRPIFAHRGAPESHRTCVRPGRAASLLGVGGHNSVWRSRHSRHTHSSFVLRTMHAHALHSLCVSCFVSRRGSGLYAKRQLLGAGMRCYGHAHSRQARSLKSRPAGGHETHKMLKNVKQRPLQQKKPSILQPTA